MVPASLCFNHSFFPPSYLSILFSFIFHPSTPVGDDSLVTKPCPTLATPWTVACQAPLSMGFSRQEYWSELPFPSPADFPDLGIKPRSPALQADSLLIELWGKTSTPVLLLSFYKYSLDLIWKRMHNICSFRLLSKIPTIKITLNYIYFLILYL